MGETPPSNSGDLSSLFDDKRREITGETLEQIRDNYYIAAKMNGSGETSVGGLNINASGRQDMSVLAKKKEKQASADMIFMAMLEASLTSIENAMAEKYGEDFAENLAAEYLDEEIYKKLMDIEDPEERRRAIAKAINDGIKNGTIDPDEINKNPDNKKWLGTHAELEKKEFESTAQLASNKEQNLDSQHSTADENKGLEIGINSLFT